MIGINLVWVFFLILVAVGFATLVIFSIFRLKGVEAENRSFLRLFPCELVSEKLPGGSAYRVVLYIYGALCFAPVFVVLPLLDEFGGLGAMALITSFLFGIEGIIMVALFLFHIKYINTHTKISTIFMAGGFLVNALAAVYAILTYSKWNQFDMGSGLTIAMAFISGLLTICSLVLVLNPKLKNWAQLVQVEGGENPVYRRPKIFPLAFSEWAIVIINFVGEVAFLISLIR